jgi:cell division protein FtsW
MFQAAGDAALKKEKNGTAPARRRSVHLKIDVPLLLVSATLGIFGLLMVYSASWDYSYLLFRDSTQIFNRQVIWFFLAIATAVVLVFLDYRYYAKLAVPMMALTIGLLVLVLVLGDVRNNAVRTLLRGSIQPSELAKLVMVIYLAVWLYSKREKLSDVSFGLIPLAGILGILGGLIFIQPDLSAVITIFFLGGLMFFLAGGDLRQIGILVLVALLFGWVVVALNSTGSDRVASYLAGLKDPFQASYHVRRSLEAFVKGGWLGVGIGNSQTKLTGLPVPPTDSIFAVIGEETGVLGAASLIILYTVMLWRGLGIARRAPDGLGTLLAAGLCLWLVMEAFVNMAVMVGLLPFAGNALPFISAGGSNLIVSAAAIGILLNISRLSVKTQEEEVKANSAVVNLRRWDRRRRISRTRRASGNQE